jgi:hypothetical protein
MFSSALPRMWRENPRWAFWPEVFSWQVGRMKIGIEYVALSTGEYAQ